MSGKLKPCPFCGSEAEHTSKPDVEVILCTLCGMGRTYEGSGSALIAMWNTRTDSEDVGKLKAQLSEAVELLNEWVNDYFNSEDSRGPWSETQELLSKHKEQP